MLIDLTAIRLRAMTTVDLSAVIKIENCAQPTPWARLSFEESLNNNHECRVLEVVTKTGSAEVAAYYVAASVLDEFQILNVVCATQFQGKGLGHCLMRDIVDVARQKNLVRLYLEVRESNRAARNLYEKWRFRPIDRRANYYRPLPGCDDKEDAIIYCCNLLKDEGLVVAANASIVKTL